MKRKVFFITVESTSTTFVTEFFTDKIKILESIQCRDCESSRHFTSMIMDGGPDTVSNLL